MLSKEECKRALENMHSQVDIETQWYSYDVLKELIDEHFDPKENTGEYEHFKLHSASTLKNQTKEELIDYIKMLYHNRGVADEQLKRVIDKAKELSDSNNELERTVCSLNCALSDVYNPKPCKFEDLKPNMWIWDIKAKWVYKINKINSKNSIEVDNGNLTFTSLVFEENRFFPVQCANLES